MRTVIMNKYANLPHVLASKSIKQSTNMIHSRMIKELESSKLVDKYSDYMYQDIKKYELLVKKNQKIVNDCCDWLFSAKDAFNDQLWDQIVGQVITDKEGNKHQLIDIWGSHNMN